MIEELARHGYKLSAGTLYPMLRSMAKKGYLVSEERRSGRSVRRIYRATPLGREASRSPVVLFCALSPRCPLTGVLCLACLPAAWSRFNLSRL